MRRRIAAAVTASAALIALVACRDPDPAVSELATASGDSGRGVTSTLRHPTKDHATKDRLPEAAAPSPERGHELVTRFECVRCHEVPGEPVPPMMKRCVGCHQAIAKGQLQAPAEVIREWQGRMHSLPGAPSLAVAAHLYEPVWIAAYLMSPRDLRPHLEATMPRLELTEGEARDIAAFLASRGEDDDEAALPRAELAEDGARLYEEKQCGSCHDFGGRMSSAADPSTLPVALAPDLRWARERVRPERLAGWIQEPPRRIAGLHMPHFPMTHEEAQALASFVLFASVEPVEPVTVPERLPPLDRPVTYAEVEERVFRKICWHCHAQPDLARGDGGPGMSGGFGFAARRLDLSTYEAINSGYLDAEGELTSLFAETDGGVPRLVAVLLARQREVAGHAGALRGMPLGFPPLSPEDIQLVESWVAQGRPR